MLKHTVSVGLIVFGTLLGSLAQANNGSGSMSKSCSGMMKVCRNGYCSDQPFFIFAFQFAFVLNNEVRSESHSFSFSGPLGTPDQYTMQKSVPGHHILYVGPEFTLAIPWEDAQGIYVSQGISGPGDEGWRLLCK